MRVLAMTDDTHIHQEQSSSGRIFYSKAQGRLEDCPSGYCRNRYRRAELAKTVSMGVNKRPSPDEPSDELLDSWKKRMKEAHDAPTPRATTPREGWGDRHLWFLLSLPGYIMLAIALYLLGGPYAGR